MRHSYYITNRIIHDASPFLPNWWHERYLGKTVFATAPETTRPWMRHVLGFRPDGFVETIICSTDAERMEREARMLPFFVPNSVYVDARPLSEGE